MGPWSALVYGYLAVAAGMLALWALARARDDAGWVDLGWTALTAALAGWCCLAGEGAADRRALVAGLYALWGLRLGGHLLRRLLRGPEDSRYAALRREGKHRWGWMFGFYQLQASWCVLFALPALAAAADPRPLGPLDAAVAIAFVLTLAGAGLADRQLSRFKDAPGNDGKVCDVGLWRISRHPNYFFEWLGWWAYPALAAGSPRWQLALIGPALMYLFLNYLTGVPLAEARSLARRGDAYRDYQRRTSAFFPWWPKPRLEEAR